MHYDIGLGTAQAFGPHHEAAAIATLTAPTSGSTRIRRPSLSNGPKPEIGFSDAINNDIVILSNASSCLVYDRPTRRDGLLWSELIEWWRGVPGVEPDEPARTLGLRLRASLASDAERGLFDTYFRLYRAKFAGAPRHDVMPRTAEEVIEIGKALTRQLGTPPTEAFLIERA